MKSRHGNIPFHQFASIQLKLWQDWRRWYNLVFHPIRVCVKGTCFVRPSCIVTIVPYNAMHCNNLLPTIYFKYCVWDHVIVSQTGCITEQNYGNPKMDPIALFTVRVNGTMHLSTLMMQQHNLWHQYNCRHIRHCQVFKTVQKKLQSQYWYYYIVI